MSHPRTFYFDGQVLGPADLQTDLAYFEALFAERNQALHLDGIAWGLEVVPGPRQRSVLVSAGLAIDPAGRALQVPEGRAVDIPEEVSTTGYVLLTAHEVPAELSDETGALGAKRTDCSPQIVISAEGVGPISASVVLARITLDARGTVVDIDGRVRRRCGTRAGTVRFAQGAAPEGAWPALRADPDVTASVLTLAADATRVQGALLISGVLSVNQLHPAAQLDVQSDRPQIAAIRVDDQTPALVLTAEGKLGVGTAQPEARMDVSGNLALDAGRALDFGGAGRIQAGEGIHGLTFDASSTTVREEGTISLCAGEGAPPVDLLPGGEVTVGNLSPKPGALLSVDGRVRSLSGGFQFAGGVVQTTAAHSTTVRVGAVLDYWAPPAHTGLVLPPEFAICDGHVVDDPESPLHGVALPNLVDRMVRGTGNYAEIGTTGGSAQHQHTITSVPKHTHGVAHRHYDYTGTTTPSLTKGASNNGVDDQTSDNDHVHSVRIPIYESPVTESAENSGDLKSAITTSPADNLPASFRLLKIMRIK
ncbi:MAG: hypothetical protein IRZ16_20030 [Myxococcaceae bacterium]|nr:hypothetical protein [Myxococcaceae bacterium]